jgi:hypothetical protein
VKIKGGWVSRALDRVSRELDRVFWERMARDPDRVTLLGSALRRRHPNKCLHVVE